MIELDHLQMQLAAKIKELNAESTQWFATIDASQIPAIADIKWQTLSEQHQWGNLLAGSLEGEEPDLTCWLVPLNDEMLKLSLSLTAKYPFSCTWFNSAWSLDKISKHWQKVTDAHLPEQKRGLLRFYDACVLQILPTILQSEQWHAVYAPCMSWLYINRTGNLSQLNTPTSIGKASSSIRISHEQLLQLEKANQADHVIAHLIAEEHLSLDSDPFKNYAKTSAAINALRQHGIEDTARCYAFCMTTIDWKIEDYQSEYLAQQLQQVQLGKLDLYSIKQSTN